MRSGMVAKAMPLTSFISSRGKPKGSQVLKGSLEPATWNSLPVIGLEPLLALRGHGRNVAEFRVQRTGPEPLRTFLGAGPPGPIFNLL